MFFWSATGERTFTLSSAILSFLSMCQIRMCVITTVICNLASVFVFSERFVLDRPESKTCNLERPPKFLVPLKMHTAPQGYECYMSCAVRGDPTPHVTWYRNNISLNTNTNYLITNTCGVCSMLILRVGPKDTGEYKVIADNALGRAECSTKLTVNGIKNKIKVLLYYIEI